jgi:AcrR family transcriptional regulator
MRVNREARAAAAAQKRAETRERLLEAAVQVIADKGAEAVSVEDFVAAAGVSRGTFYNYFPTVQDLILALNLRIAHDIDRRLSPVRLEVSDPAARMAAILHRMWIAFADDPLKAWVAARIEASGAARLLPWDQEFANLYGRAVKAGRFAPGDYAAARTIVFGAMRMGVRDLFTGHVGEDHAEPLIAGVLCACGMDREEAAKVSAEQAAAARKAMRKPG